MRLGRFGPQETIWAAIGVLRAWIGCHGCRGRSIPTGRTSNVREERLALRLGGGADKIQLPERVASSIAHRLRARESDLERARDRSSVRLLNRQRALQAKIDRGYDDYLDGLVSDTLWARNRVSGNRARDCHG